MLEFHLLIIVGFYLVLSQGCPHIAPVNAHCPNKAPIRAQCTILPIGKLAKTRGKLQKTTQERKREAPSLHDATSYWLHANSIPKIGCHYFWPGLIGLPKNTLPTYSNVCGSNPLIPIFNCAFWISIEPPFSPRKIIYSLPLHTSPLISPSLLNLD
jgi:hypothetical protein